MFRFEHIEHFWLLVAIPGLFLLLWQWQRWRSATLYPLGQPARLMQPLSGQLFWWKNGLLAMAIGLMAFAWANPQRGMKKQTVTQESADVFIALDISNSMLCEDIAPNRLELAKVFAEKLIKSLVGERVGLIFFAGNAFVQMPLSTDYGFTLEALRSANTDLMSEQGTAISAAVDLASKSYDPNPGGGRAIIIITDGESHDEEALDRVKEAFSDGIVVFTVGAGTENGGPIPTGSGRNGQYKRDEKNEVVMTHMDEQMLKKLAAAGGGNAYNVVQGEKAIKSLTKSVNTLEKRAMEVRSFSEFETWYQWFLLPALLLLFIDLFLGWGKKTVMLLVMFLCCQPISAQNRHQKMLEGDDLYKRDQYTEAAKAYKSAKEQGSAHPNAAYNLGNALYEQGNYEEAGSAYQESANQAKNPLYKADALHNQGNALLKQSKYKEAVQAYETSLRLRPGDAGTKTNLQLAKKKVKEEQKKQQEQQKKQEQDQQQNQQQDQQPQDKQQQDQQQQKNQQQKQDQQSQQEQQGEQAEKPGQMKPGEARQLLESAIKPEDQRNARKYRAMQQQQQQNKKSKKDW